MIGPLKRVLRSSLSAPNVVFECRRCGATVSRRADECPACEEGEVVRYEI